MRADHPLRVIPPERLMRALLLQAFYSIRSERQLVERIGYDLLFRWFVGLGIEDAVWDATSFTKNRDRLLDGAVAGKFLAAVLSQGEVKRLLSSSTFRSMARCWKPGRARRASARRTALASRLARGEMVSATSMASAAAMIRTLPPPTLTPGSSAKDPAKKRGCVSWATH